MSWSSFFLELEFELAVSTLNSFVALFRSTVNNWISFYFESKLVVNFSTVLLYSSTRALWSSIILFLSSQAANSFRVESSYFFHSFSFSDRSFLDSFERPTSFKSSGVFTTSTSRTFSFSSVVISPFTDLIAFST